MLILLVVFDIPFGRTFEFDNDEGINLMKAFLYWKGIPLYTETWNDQPPLLTVILSAWFNIVGSSVVATRLLILGFSILLIGSFYQILKDKLGRLPALLGSLFLMLSWSYAKLSVSVMIGLPSLALAVLSVYILTLYQRYHHKILLILSGGLLALSLQVKLFTVFLIPLVVLLILIPEQAIKKADQDKQNSLSSVIKKVALWLGSVAITYLAIGGLFNSIHYDQLWQSHVEDSIKNQYDATNGVPYLLSIIRNDLDLVGLAAIATLSLFLQRRWADLFPFAWFLTALLLLLNHRPIWYHHYLLLSIPLAWLAAYGVAIAVEFFRQAEWRDWMQSLNVKRIVIPGVALILMGVAIASIPAKIASPWGRPSSQWEIVEILEQHRDQTRWVFSDRPIIPFYAALPVPPEVAVLSNKRLAAGNFTYDNLLEVLQTYRPEQVVLARRTQEIKSHRGIYRFLRQNYTRTYAKAYSRSDPTAIAEHYLIKDLPQGS
ncbi:glycosyltransferase family 39 protein [Oscillatoria sp. FACHB-1407]|uniref:ArnT family glycosyltransferase n=1 Tax=Oscillatoria sp. FACHB-1407 TaxID=2692847 RepID=UPI0019CCCEEB|nr:glycosyltransferase family 39 protein [Oscillatoria sp. FACHB-1407]